MDAICKILAEIDTVESKKKSPLISSAASRLLIFIFSPSSSHELQCAPRECGSRVEEGWNLAQPRPYDSLQLAMTDRLGPFRSVTGEPKGLAGTFPGD